MGKSERYLHIGNLRTDSVSEIEFVGDGGVGPDYVWNFAAYYIDDVWLSHIDSAGYVSINEELEIRNEELSLYPNPNQGTFTVQLPLAANQEATMEVWSVSGQLVHTERLYAGSNHLQLQVADGLYLYRVMVNREPKWLGKISIGSE